MSERKTQSRAEMSGVSVGTLNSIGSRIGYTVTLEKVEKISRALEIPLQELLEQIPDPPKAKRTAGRKRGGG